MKKSITVTLISVITLLIVWFVWDGFIRDNTPEFFPINEQKGQYSIIKSPSGIFEIQYAGPGALNDEGHISVLVGKTNYNLNDYVGKAIRITKGKFISGYTEQCITDVCTNIGGPYAVINIEELVELQK